MSVAYELVHTIRTRTLYYRYLQLFEPVAPTAAVGWSGCLIAAPNPVGKGFASLKDLLGHLWNPGYCSASIFFTANEKPKDLDGAAIRLRDILDRAVPSYKPHHDLPVTLICWFDPATVWPVPALLFQMTQVVRPSTYQFSLAATQPAPLLPLGAGQGALALENAAAKGAMLYYDADMLALASRDATCKIGLKVIGAGGTDTGILTMKGIPSAAVSGANFFFKLPMVEVDGPLGSLAFEANVEAGFGTLGTALHYGVEVAGTGQSTIDLAYPLLASMDGLTGAPVSVLFNPLKATDTAATCIRFEAPPASAAASVHLTTNFRTLLGHGIDLTPQTLPAQDGVPPALIFYRSPGDVLYPAPSGDFVIGTGAIAEPATAAGNKLLCGLAGTEYLDFVPGKDMLRFVPGLGATIHATQSDANGPTGYGLLDDTAYRTPWVAFRQDTAETAARFYYSEPVGQPLYAAAASAASQSVLSYYPVTQNRLPPLPAGEDAQHCFPLVPYAGVIAQDAQAEERFAAIEYRLFAPVRHTRIGAFCHPGNAPAGMPVLAGGSDATQCAVTPGGYQACFDQGNWKSLTFAQSGGQTIQVSAADGAAALPPAVQSAFLSSQQFVVFSRNSGSNFGKLSFSLSMSGWDLDISPPATQTLGDYRNVVVFKSAKGRFVDWIKAPERWAGYEDFNDANADSTGAYLSQWLQQYCADAIAAYEAGNASLQTFAETVVDKEWTGFLALKVGIDPSHLDPTLEPLLGGIDLSRFFAHHVGNESTRVLPGTGGYQLDSNLFALIHYEDAAYTANKQVIPGYVQIDGDYDFRVETLTALFLKSGIASFDCRLMFAMNRLFGSRVGTGGSGGALPATNRILLEGSVQTTTGPPVYAFRTPKGVSAFFNLTDGAVSLVEVSQAEFALTGIQGNATDPHGKHITSRFTLWGRLGFWPGPVLREVGGEVDCFDIYSFDRLAFDTLAVSMEFDLLRTAGTYRVQGRGFTFLPQRMTLKSLPLKQSDATFPNGYNYYRPGSFLDQFPVKVGRFVTGAETPEALGYGKVEALPYGQFGLDGALGESWYGINLELQLGSLGALANNAVLGVELLFAWDPDARTFYSGVRLPGLGPLDKLFDIDGIVTFGAQGMRMSRVDSTAHCGNKDVPAFPYVIEFTSIGLHLLSLSFPPSGTTNISVFGDPCQDKGAVPTAVGWFGSYVSSDLATQAPASLVTPQRGRR